MVLKKMNRKEMLEPPKNLVMNKLDPIDIYILNKLNDKTYGWEKRSDLSDEEKKLLEEYRRKPWKKEGASISTLNVEINKDLGINLKRGEVEERIDRLAEDGILIRQHAIIIEPTKLYDHVFHLYLKIPIASPLRTALTKETFAWWEAIEKIWDTDKEEFDEFGKPFDIVREIGTMEGTGEYDVILLIYTNDIQRFSGLLRRLTEKGYIEKSMTQRIWSPTGMKFDPIKIPDYYDYVESIAKYTDLVKYIEKEEKRKIHK